MALSLLDWLFIVLLISLHNAPFATATQGCYYPNGDISTEDVPCGSGGATICCPLNWDCMSDGLCYLANEDYYERHTCTDKSWPSNACPGICTHDMTANGNEALLWCSNGEWCCDGNRSWNCCTTADTQFFKLPDPHSFAFISVTPSVNPSSVLSSAAPTHTGGQSSASSLGPSSTQPSTPTSSSTTSARTKTLSHVTTGNNGVASTVTSVVVASAGPAATGPSQKSHSSSHSNLPVIVGLAVGVPLVCILCGLVIFLLFRYYRTPNKGIETRPPSPPIRANYQNILAGSHAPELAGYPVAAKRTKSGRESELYGSEPYNSPTTSTGTNATSPPQYSPGNVEGMTQIQEEPQELWGGYVPYRPPQTEVPREDEVPAVKQIDRSPR